MVENGNSAKDFIVKSLNFIEIRFFIYAPKLETICTGIHNLHKKRQDLPVSCDTCRISV